MDFNDDVDDELVTGFNEPVLVLFIDCFNRGLRDVVVNDFGDGGERFVLLLLLVEVNAVNSARIELAEGFEVVVLVTSFVVFFSLNPVANDAQPLVFFVVVPFVNDEFELDIDELLIVLLSDVVESDDLSLNEKSPVVVTSVIEFDGPFFAVDKVDSVDFDLLFNADVLLFVLVSLIEVWDCCLLLINLRHFEQYHKHRGSLISAVLTGGL